MLPCLTVLGTACRSDALASNQYTCVAPHQGFPAAGAVDSGCLRAPLPSVAMPAGRGTPSACPEGAMFDCCRSAWPCLPVSEMLQAVYFGLLQALLQVAIEPAEPPLWVRQPFMPQRHMLSPRHAPCRCSRAALHAPAADAEPTPCPCSAAASLGPAAEAEPSQCALMR